MALTTMPPSAWPPEAAPPLLAFTPRVLVHVLQRHASRPPLLHSSSSSPSFPSSDASPPLLLSRPCCVLFIDVSGFTSLTESFVAGGASGLEQLAGHLSAYFTGLLQLVTRHGGDLLKIAGDALIVAFYHEEDEGEEGQDARQASADSVTPDPLPLLCLRAIVCAQALQSSPTFTAGRVVSLRLHIGVGCGLTHFIAVGGHRQLWEEPGAGRGGGGLGERQQSLSSPSSPATVRSPPYSSPSSPTSTTLPASPFQPLSPLQSPTFHPPRLSLTSPPPLRLQASSAGAGDGRWEFLAVGVAFTQLRSAVHDSGTGEVVCSAAVWQQLTALRTLAPAVDVQGQPVPGASGNLLVTRLANPPAYSRAGYAPAPVVLSSGLSLSSFLMPALLSRMDSGASTPSHWLGEYRRVTVVFVTLPLPESCVAGGRERLPVADRGER